MTTYSYSGRLTDFGETPFPGAEPRLIVAPSGAAFGPTGVLTTRQIVIPVASNGSFSVDLVASADTSPTTTYVLRCEWLTSAGVAQGWSDLPFTAAVGGGAITDMVDAPVSTWWVGPPWPNPLRKGFYFDKVTNDVGRFQ